MKDKTWLERLRYDALKALYMLALCAVVGVGFNFFRENRLLLVARENYENVIFQPCPETEKVAEETKLRPVSDGSGISLPADAVIVDCRLPEAYQGAHIPGAMNVPYDELEGVASEEIAKLKRFKKVIVYCDGWAEEEDPEARYANPPSSLLADELKSQGIEDASFLQGGLKGYVDSGGKLTSEGGAP
jgi:3-mercaptopyruvate sulfurtransferase SseA